MRHLKAATGAIATARILNQQEPFIGTVAKDVPTQVPIYPHYTSAACIAAFQDVGNALRSYSRFEIAALGGNRGNNFKSYLNHHRFLGRVEVNSPPSISHVVYQLKAYIGATCSAICISLEFTFTIFDR